VYRPATPGRGVSTYEFRLPLEGEPETIGRFAAQLREQLLDHAPGVLWQRVSDCTDGTLYAALTIEGPMEAAAQALTDAFNATAALVPGVRHAGT